MIQYELNTAVGECTPWEYVIKQNFSLDIQDFNFWVNEHKLGNTRTKAWIEDMFTELNYHEEVKDLQKHNYTKLLK